MHCFIWVKPSGCLIRGLARLIGVVASFAWINGIWERVLFIGIWLGYAHAKREYLHFSRLTPVGDNWFWIKWSADSEILSIAACEFCHSTNILIRHHLQNFMTKLQAVKVLDHDIDDAFLKSLSIYIYMYTFSLLYIYNTTQIKINLHNWFDSIWMELKGSPESPVYI
jgi:hypothetical protein